MGSITSKPNDPLNQTYKSEIEIDTNPDPRSPTPEITRTPLQNKNGSKHNITKNADLRKTFEVGKGGDKIVYNNPIFSAVIKNHLQSYDPRSPTQDFERTPIIIGGKVDVENNTFSSETGISYGSPSLNDTNYEYNNSTEANIDVNTVVPKNLCNGFLDMTLNETVKDNDEPLGSSTASNEAIELNNVSNENEKMVGLLETNFEYVNNDTDQLETSADCTDKICQGVEEYTCEDMKNVAQLKILKDDPRSPSLGIERTPIVVANLEKQDKNIEDMTDDILIKALQSANIELRAGTRMQDKGPEGLLIYEDNFQNLNETPKKVKSTGSNDCRTPLSCMKNKTETPHVRSKSANMLFDPKNPKGINKSVPKRVSQIPRLKSLTKQTTLVPIGSSISLKNIAKAVGGDCENTPPNSHRDKWDKDNSIIL